MINDKKILNILMISSTFIGVIAGKFIYYDFIKPKIFPALEEKAAIFSENIEKKDRVVFEITRTKTGGEDAIEPKNTEKKDRVVFEMLIDENSNKPR